METSEINFILPRLQASNSCLLKIYYSLFYEIDGEEMDAQRELLCSRIAMREKFKLELMQLLEEEFSSAESGFLNSVLNWVAHKEFTLKRVFSRPLWESCKDLEQENIKIYYDLLYSQRFSSSITNLLLSQKEEVENTITQELSL